MLLASECAFLFRRSHGQLDPVVAIVTFAFAVIGAKLVPGIDHQAVEKVVAIVAAVVVVVEEVLQVALGIAGVWK